MKAKYMAPLIISFLLGAFIAWQFLDKPSRGQSTASSPSIIVRDTIFEIVPQKIVAFKTKARVVIRDTSKVETSPFEASIDTLIAKDSITVSYSFPENSIRFKFASTPDTVAKYNLMIYDTERKSRDLWMGKIGIFAAGLAAGFIISKIK